MVLITPIFIVAITMLETSVVHSQDLQIHQGNKTKTFKVGELIRIDLPVEESKNRYTTPKNNITGRLISCDKDSCRLQVQLENLVLKGNGNAIGNQTINYYSAKEKEWPYVSIPKKDIWGITFQGKKSLHVDHGADIVGSLLMYAGTLTAVSTLFASGEENEDELTNASVILFGTGAAMVLVFNRKTYRTNLAQHIKHVNKVWAVQ